MTRTFQEHLVLPDQQAAPGHPDWHLEAAGRYALEKRPNVIVALGDWADMPSLSSYDKKSGRGFEGRRYRDDIAAANASLARFHAPIEQWNKRRKKHNQYLPRLVYCRGNHEYRIQRAVDDDPHTLEGIIGYSDLDFERRGWEVHDFLHIVEIDGVRYSHYFTNPLTGRPWGGTCATMLKNIGFSFTMGHRQVLDMAVRHLADGTIHRGLVAGAFYEHDEDYKGPQGNKHWRGILHKFEVKDGGYDLLELSIDFLRRKYA